MAITLGQIQERLNSAQISLYVSEQTQEALSSFGQELTLGKQISAAIEFAIRVSEREGSFV